MKYLTCGILAMLLVLSNIVSAQQKPPDGFGGLMWGDNIKEFFALTNPSPWPLFGETDSIDKYTFEFKKYFRSGRRLLDRIADVPVDEAYYFFYKERYYSIKIKFKGHDNFRVFKDALVMKYGKPIKESPIFLKINPTARIGTETSWIVEQKVEINLSINEMSNEGSLDYSYLPIVIEFSKDQKKSAEKTKDSL
jgi:hypothetical protein